MSVADRRRDWACVTLLLVLLGWQGQELLEGLFARRALTPPAGTDFAGYYLAGRVARGDTEAELYASPSSSRAASHPWTGAVALVEADSAWGRLAQANSLGRTFPYNAPPLTALLFAPLSRLPPRAAYFSWQVLTLLLLAASVPLALRPFGSRRDDPTLLLALAGALAFSPAQETLETGQMGVLVLFLWALGTSLAASGRSAASGLCFAAGTLVKLTPVLAVPVFLLRRDRRWLLAFAAGITAGLALSMGLLGWEPHRRYAMDVLPAISRGAPTLHNKSLSALLTHLAHGAPGVEGVFARGLDGRLGFAFNAASLVLYVAALVVMHRRRAGTVDQLLAAALLSLLISPLSWRHTYVLALLPLLRAWTSAAPLAPREGPLLLAATVAMATRLPDLLAARMPGWAQLPLMAVVPAGALLALALAVRTARTQPDSH